MKLSVQIEFDKTINFDIDKTSCVVGRSSQCDIVIPHSSISRVHCKIESNKSLFYITDMGSTNGVFIDEKRISPHQKTPFLESSELSLGGLQSHLTHGDFHHTSTPLSMKSLEKSFHIPKKKGTQVTLSRSRIDLQRPPLATEVKKTFVKKTTVTRRQLPLKNASVLLKNAEDRPNRNPFFLYIMLISLGSALFILKDYL